MSIRRTVHVRWSNAPILGLAVLLCCHTLCMAQANLSPERLRYQKLFGEAVRSAADAQWNSVVTVERIGADETESGEVTQDAPTSGVIVDSDGYILTSNLVARGASASILVRTADGTRYAAKMVAQDRHRNLVLLKIDAKETLTPISLVGKTLDELRVGETTIAVGRYGSNGDSIVSTGILSALDRLEGIAMQSDARISPSFYGGLLLNLDGDPLGIIVPAVAAGGAEDETSWYDAGVGFAIPVNVIANKLDRLKRGDDIRKGLIGIVARSKDPYESDTTVAAVRLRSPAEQAGLQSGDVVISIAGKEVIRHQQIKEALGPYDANDEIVVSWKRDGEVMNASVTLAETIPPLEPQRLGVVVAEVRGDGSGKDVEPLIEVTGVVPGTPADSTLKLGDRLVKLGEAAVTSVDGLRSAVMTLEPDQKTRLTIRRDGNDMPVEFTPASYAGDAVTDYPEAWTAVGPTEGDVTAENKKDENKKLEWQIDLLQLPDSANKAAILKPAGATAQQPVEKTGVTGAEPRSLGLFLALCPPGSEDPAKMLESWKDVAQANGVVVCAVAPENEDGWKPKEIEIIGRFASAAMKQASIHISSVGTGSIAVASGAEPTAADSMALAVAITESNRFRGLIVPTTTRPPAIRMKENDPSSSVQILFSVGENDDLPTWAAKLTQVGYPIVSEDDLNRASLLRWIRLLQSI